MMTILDGVKRELTLALGCHVDLDAADQDRSELFHLLEGPRQPIAVDLVRQLLLSTVNLLRHLRQHWTQVLAGRQGCEWWKHTEGSGREAMGLVVGNIQKIRSRRQCC